MDACSVVCFDTRDDLKVFQEIAAVVDRKNPHRRHLILSKVTGKHVAASTDEVTLWGNRLTSLIASQPALIDAAPNCVGVLGFAETATGLAAQVAEGLNAEVLAQSTRDSEGLSNPLRFSEAHSHAPTIFISRQAIAHLAHVNHIVIVDDELTTGSTLLNLIDLLRGRGLQQPITAACLVDARPAHHRDRFSKFESTANWDPTTVVALCRAVISEEGLPSDPLTPVSVQNTQDHNEQSPPPNVLGVLTTAVPIPDTRYGVGLSRRACFQALESFGENLRTDHGWANPLVLGLEEEVFPAYLLSRGLRADVQCTTRSPIRCHTLGSYPIRSAAMCSSVINSSEKAFLYNVSPDHGEHTYSDVVIVDVQRHRNSQVHPSVLRAAGRISAKLWIVQIPTYIDIPR